jgi:hypothetical protein
MYGGKPHTILIDMTHGRNGLTVMRIGVKKVSIYRNSDGQGSPTLQKYTADMKEEVVNKVLNDPLKDYGVGIQKFMKTARKLWLSEMNFDAYDKDRVVA